MRTGTIITICDGDLDLHDDLEEAAAGFCFPDAIADYTTVMDSAGRFYRAESEDYSAWFVLDENREPDPQFLVEQLRMWIDSTADVIDYGLADPGSADVPTLIAAIRNGRRTTPMPTFWSAIRKHLRTLTSDAGPSARARNSRRMRMLWLSSSRPSRPD